MKQLLIMLFVAFAFVACTTKETKETHTETVVHDEAPASQPADDPKVEISVSDTGSGMKIKVP